MIALPKFLRLNDARKRKNEILASLSVFEVEILDLIAHGGTVYGGAGLRIILLSRNRLNQQILERGSEIRALVRNGWLRFSPMGATSGGYFWMTDASERLWSVLGR